MVYKDETKSAQHQSAQFYSKEYKNPTIKMKLLVVVAAFLAIASAAPELREKRGLLATTVLAGPAGTVVASPGLVASPILARSVLAPGLIAPGLVAPAATVLAAPGITAGTVVAPGTTLIGPSTNGAPGAVITNGLLGTQILV